MTLTTCCKLTFILIKTIFYLIFDRSEFLPEDLQNFYFLSYNVTLDIQAMVATKFLQTLRNLEEVFETSSTNGNCNLDHKTNFLFILLSSSDDLLGNSSARPF